LSDILSTALRAIVEPQPSALLVIIRRAVEIDEARKLIFSCLRFRFQPFNAHGSTTFKASEGIAWAAQKGFARSAAPHESSSTFEIIGAAICHRRNPHTP
jgi:hypothetical protein